MGGLIVDAVRSASGVSCTHEVLRLAAGDAARTAAVDVEVWQVSAHERAFIADVLATLLDPDERERAARFRFSEDHDRYVTARGITRHILAAYLGADARDLTFGESPKGKPLLRAVGQAPPHFNWSHAGSRVVVAVASRHQVGIDIECTDAPSQIEAVSDTILTQADLRWIDGGQGPTRVRQLLRVWTRKEAALKAVGCGLSIPMSAFDAGPPGEGRSHVVGIPSAEGVRRVLVRDLADPTDFVGAVGAVVPT